MDVREGRMTVSHEGSVAWIEPDVEGESRSEYESDELTFVEGLIGWAAEYLTHATPEV